MMCLTTLRLLLVLLATILVLPACGDEAQAAQGTEEAAKDATGEETDETKSLLKQLTIGMISEVLDERTVLIRDTGAKAGKRSIHLRLGNVGAVARGSLDDGEYAEKVNVAKAALLKLVDKQMVWYKAAPESLQAPSSPGSEPDVVIADLWSIDGKHISTALKKDGHLAHAEEYENAELGKDILTVAAEVEKKESYKKLEEALKESEVAKKAAQKEARVKEEAEKEAEDVEGFGLGGWAGVSVLLLIGVGVATNFGRAGSRKLNLNRKKGVFERFWTKLKGA